MADEKEPVTDSRLPGFNPEVEESHAAAEAATAAQPKPDAGPPPPVHTHRCAACGGLFEHALEVCEHCGATLIEKL